MTCQPGQWFSTAWHPCRCWRIGRYGRAMSVIDARHLTAVSETALLTLHQRATEAARADGIITDPMAIRLRADLGYDYQHFGRTHQATALRALAFDSASRRYLQAHPRATVVALAEGLQTSFWRLDNGEMSWLSVDLDPIVQLRRALLPASDRLRHLAQSALDHSWMDQVDATNGVLITAEGLFQYLEREAVFDLISACAIRFPGGQLDLRQRAAISELVLAAARHQTQQGVHRTADAVLLHRRPVRRAVRSPRRSHGPGARNAPGPWQVHGTSSGGCLPIAVTEAFPGAHQHRRIRLRHRSSGPRARKSSRLRARDPRSRTA